MAKLNWDRVAVEEIVRRNGSEHIETEAGSHRGMTALRCWKDVTISLRESRKQHARRIRLIKKEGTVISLSRKRPEKVPNSNVDGIAIRALAEELAVVPMAIVRYARSIGDNVSTTRQTIPRHLAKKIRRHFRN
jgi:predicted metal-dependent hydrolase